MKRFTLLLLIIALLALPALALAQESTPEPAPVPPVPPVQFVGIEMPEWYTTAFTVFVVLVPIVVVVLSVAGVVLPTIFFRALLTLAQITRTRADDDAIIDWAIQSGYVVTFDEQGNIIIVDGREETPTSSLSTRN
jgi:hypothetical protein